MNKYCIFGIAVAVVVLAHTSIIATPPVDSDRIHKLLHVGAGSDSMRAQRTMREIGQYEAELSPLQMQQLLSIVNKRFVEQENTPHLRLGIEVDAYVDALAHVSNRDREALFTVLDSEHTMTACKLTIIAALIRSTADRDSLRVRLRAMKGAEFEDPNMLAGLAVAHMVLEDEPESRKPLIDVVIRNLNLDHSDARGSETARSVTCGMLFLTRYSKVLDKPLEEALTRELHGSISRVHDKSMPCRAFRLPALASLAVHKPGQELRQEVDHARRIAIRHRDATAIELTFAAAQMNPDDTDSYVDALLPILLEIAQQAPNTMIFTDYLSMVIPALIQDSTIDYLIESLEKDNPMIQLSLLLLIGGAGLKADAAVPTVLHVLLGSEDADVQEISNLVLSSIVPIERVEELVSVAKQVKSARVKSLLNATVQSIVNARRK